MQPSPPDAHDVVYARLRTLRRTLQHLEPLGDLSVQQLKADPTARAAAERWIQVGLAAAFDAGDLSPTGGSPSRSGALAELAGFTDLLARLRASSTEVRADRTAAAIATLLDAGRVLRRQLLEELADQCLASVGGRALLARVAAGTGDIARSDAAAALATAVLMRRGLAVHRHIHLVAAFLDADRRQPITSALAVGCGAGLTELFLAATHPDVSFTLTDLDADRLAVAEQFRAAHGLDNVRFASLDLLDPPGAERFDFVSSIEVLEHIEDHERAARHQLALSRRFTYVLVPYRARKALRSEAVWSDAWTKAGHHRPGYTQDDLRALVGGAGDVRWLRNTYFEPECTALRDRMRDTDDQTLASARVDTFVDAAVDVRDERVERGMTEAAGVEVLVERAV